MRLLVAAAMFAAVVSADVPMGTQLSKDGIAIRLDRASTLPLTDPDYSGKDGAWVTFTCTRLFVSEVHITVAARLVDGTSIVRTKVITPVYVGKQARVYFPLGTIEQVLSVSVKQVSQPTFSDF